MQRNKSHSLQNAFLHSLRRRITDLIVADMTPPQKHVGIIQNFIGKTVFRLVHYGRPNRHIFVLTQKIRNRLMDSLRVDRTDLLADRFMIIFVPYRHSYHGRFTSQINSEPQTKPSFSKRAFAACCSASFLLLPEPSAKFLSFVAFCAMVTLA